MTYFVKYVGKGEKTIAGVGAFTSDTPPRKVSKEVAMDFDNPKEKAHGWIVTKENGESKATLPSPTKVPKKGRWRG